MHHGRFHCKGYAGKQPQGLRSLMPRRASPPVMMGAELGEAAGIQVGRHDGNIESPGKSLDNSHHKDQPVDPPPACFFPGCFSRDFSSSAGSSSRIGCWSAPRAVERRLADVRSTRDPIISRLVNKGRGKPAARSQRAPSGVWRGCGVRAEDDRPLRVSAAAQAFRPRSSPPVSGDCAKRAVSGKRRLGRSPGNPGLSPG